jgi:hypothetical protein
MKGATRRREDLRAQVQALLCRAGTCATVAGPLCPAGADREVLICLTPVCETYPSPQQIFGDGNTNRSTQRLSQVNVDSMSCIRQQYSCGHENMVQRKGR